MRIIYEADDGSTFESLEDCEQYEMKKPLPNGRGNLCKENYCATNQCAKS